MAGSDAARERAAARLRQRLWGATVLIALAVIVLPLLLDGSGSESQFRRVERLREEPPRILTADGEARDTGAPVLAAATEDGAGTDEAPVRPTPDFHVGEDDPPDYFRERAADPRPPIVRRSRGELPRAWVVQAGSFREQANALAVRDVLRRAGHPTFVAHASESGPPLYRVQVGPLVDEGRAERLRDKVIELLGRDAIVVPYP